MYRRDGFIIKDDYKNEKNKRLSMESPEMGKEEQNTDFLLDFCGVFFVYLELE